LTGLPNRQGLFEVLAELSADRQAEASVIFVDLDNFKWVNDTLGHEAGDIVLQEAARRFAQCVREGDTIARLGGDEFAIVTRSSNSSSVARGIADRALRAMSTPFIYGNNTFFVGCSVGFASLGKHTRSTEELLRLADLAMYNSKQEGRNRISEYSTDLGERTQSLAATHARIRTALKENQFRLFYQPIIRLSTMQIAGAEALLRLQCPNEGAIPAAEVIRVAEQSGLIGQIGEWVLQEGFDRIASGMPQDIAQGSYLSINLSPKQLDRRFMRDLADRLAGSPGIARHLVLEITETALLDQDESVASFIRDIRATGARVALDDFGIGYSSLNYISRFPVDIVKLDRSFISGLSASIAEGGSRNLALIKATVTLAGELDMAIVAEGIEDEATLRTLQDLGIDLGQGYLFSPPLPEQPFVEWLSAFSGRFAGLCQQHRMSA
jgi:diguanylate cyclase (GGDEF)-like protein